MESNYSVKWKIIYLSGGGSRFPPSPKANVGEISAIEFLGGEPDGLSHNSKELAFQKSIVEWDWSYITSIFWKMIHIQQIWA